MKCPFTLHNNGNGRSVILENFTNKKESERMGRDYIFYKGTDYSINYYSDMDDAFSSIYISEYETKSGNFYILTICGVDTFLENKDELDSAVMEYFWWTGVEDEAEEMGLITV